MGCPMAERKTPLHFRVEINIDGRKLTEREQKALHKWASSLFSGVPEVSVDQFVVFDSNQRFEFRTPNFWERKRTKYALGVELNGEKS